jgi:iron complex outermembrane receptor protein
VWEHYVNNWLRTSASTYWYQADRLIGTTPNSSLAAGYSFVNQGRVRAKGLEFEAQMRLRREARALVSYAMQSAVDQQTDRHLPNSPRHLAKARLSVPGPTARSFISAEMQYLSSRTTVSGSTVQGQTTINLTIRQPLGRSWELFGGARNFLDATLADPASSQHQQDVIPQNGRMLRIGLRWQVWGGP